MIHIPFSIHLLNGSFSTQQIRTTLGGEPAPSMTISLKKVGMIEQGWVIHP
jgi:predicted DNA-binding ArsR family transcriptional regulator